MPPRLTPPVTTTPAFLVPASVLGAGSTPLPLSSRDGEALRGERGGPGCHAAVRPWGRTCGQEYAQRLRR